MNLSENLIAKIYANLYTKKITLYTVEGTTVNLKSSTINEFVELLDKCRQLLKTDQVICR